MSPSQQGSRAGSVWIRFWWPTAALEPTPAHASAPERAAIRTRNYVWLKTYMDIYILRWGALWAACLVLALVTTDDSVPGALFALALTATMMSLFGLLAMILIYRRAARALKDRAV
ncbi:hypothetical protein H6CHR_00722 [Variovorax sp. PBL-H6]|uniref:hypothetical protein n=1 Tax=Variovorax sp. PBL-H6 TaxID=434009 RepID=UPI001316DF46|nr:hypothetical protein [Variovorax sp. PBL-H6]VTU17228.1 hypothetical protein H6CHR_00722 [Variovorax sp. PBL-H6]